MVFLIQKNGQRQWKIEKKENINVTEIIRGIFTVKTSMVTIISLQNFPNEYSEEKKFCELVAGA